MSLANADLSFYQSPMNGPLLRTQVGRDSAEEGSYGGGDSHVERTVEAFNLRLDHDAASFARELNVTRTPVNAATVSSVMQATGAVSNRVAADSFAAIAGTTSSGTTSTSSGAAGAGAGSAASGASSASASDAAAAAAGTGTVAPSGPTDPSTVEPTEEDLANERYDVNEDGAVSELEAQVGVAMDKTFKMTAVMQMGQANGKATLEMQKQRQQAEKMIQQAQKKQRH
ncbi:MAG: hypothetical protein P8176_01330 [Gammaproteobacteria bacterium]